MPKGYVYILKEIHGENYKIGQTKHPHTRRETFNVKLPFEVEYDYVIESEDCQQLESKLQSIFAHRHVNGEWYQLTVSDLDFIRNNYKGYKPKPGSNKDARTENRGRSPIKDVPQKDLPPEERNSRLIAFRLNKRSKNINERNARDVIDRWLRDDIAKDMLIKAILIADEQKIEPPMGFVLDKEFFDKFDENAKRLGTGLNWLSQKAKSGELRLVNPES